MRSTKNINNQNIIDNASIPIKVKIGDGEHRLIIAIVPIFTALFLQIILPIFFVILTINDMIIFFECKKFK